MTSKAAGLIVAVALFAPALATAKPGHGPAVKAAVKACVQERKLGREAFVNKYGHPAQRNCVREILPEARNAADACRAERNEDGVEAFRDNWGENANGANAFGKCVSGTLHQAEENETAEEPEEPEAPEGGSA
jgi:hypothetical protein